MLTEIVERYAQFEKRAMALYRGLAERFGSDPAAARVWRDLSDTEASHFALLELAQDWIAMARGAGGAPPVTAADLDRLAARLTQLEETANRPDCGIAEAVELTVSWEELELPRIVELTRYLPAQAQGRVLAGMVAEAAEHYRMLGELVRAAGTPAQADRVAGLERAARQALG